MKPKYKVGDWIRFYQAGRLVIGVVSYIEFNSTFDSCPRYQTDLGEVSEDYIKEGR